MVMMSNSGVDGVYDADPRTDPQARKLEKVTFADALRGNLKVVDAAAFSLCMENKLPMVVFGMEGDGNITRALRGSPSAISGHLRLTGGGADRTTPDLRD